MERLGRDDTGTRPGLTRTDAESGRRSGARADPPGGRRRGDVSARQRTTIGRTPDNDIQIDTTYISRHHAVLLSNADDCIVEDLNSTNGVLVNGRRVGRQVLRDGDTLTVGKTEFSYQQRS